MNVRIKFVDGHEETFESVTEHRHDYILVLRDAYENTVFRGYEGHVMYLVYTHE